MTAEFEELRVAYAAELRESKDAAEHWWNDLNERYKAEAGSEKPEDLWPMGAASHPWVIATYRKYFFLCVELNRKVRERSSPIASRNEAASEQDWGTDDIEPDVDTIEPKLFVLTQLLGGETHDLYEFLLSLVFVPIGLKADELV